jgi:hypothetical protein
VSAGIQSNILSISSQLVSILGKSYKGVGDIRTTWNSIKPSSNGVGVGTLFTIAYEYGYVKDKKHDKINTRVNRRDNQELTTQRNWQHRIHKTRYNIDVRENRSLFCHVSCVYDVVSVSMLFIVDCPFCLL